MPAGGLKARAESADDLGMGQRLRGDDAGFGMVEMLAALAVVAVVGTAVAGGLTTATKASAGSRHRVVAASLATQALEQARSMPATSLVAPSTTTFTQNVDGRAYTLTRDVAWRNAPGVTLTACHGAGMFKHVALSVTWTGATSPVTSDTLIAPPETGSQRVRVLDRNRVPRSGVPVSVSGPTPVAPQTTDSNGCVLFPGLSAGTYTVTVSQSGGTYPFVDTQGQTVATRIVAITATDAPPLLEVQYDTSGALAGTPVPTATDGQSYPVASPVGATAFHSDMLPAGTRSVLAATPTTIGSLFPFRTGQHRVWAGTCTDADPAFHGFGRPAPVTVTSGAATAASLATKPVYIRVKSAGNNGAGSNYGNEFMYAVHASTQGCGPVTNPGDAGGTVGMAVLLPTKTDSSGYARVSLPYGTWRFEPRDIDAGVYRAVAADGTVNSVTLTPNSTTAPSVMRIDVY